MTKLLKKTIFAAAILFAQMAFGQSHAAGNEAMQLEDWDKAISIFSGLTKADPTDQSAFLSLGNAYLAKSYSRKAEEAAAGKGDIAKAAESFTAAYNAKSDGPMAYIANGRNLLLQNNSAEADKQFTKAKKYAKKDMTIWRQIGESYFYYIEPNSKKPNLTRAEGLLNEALEVSSKDFALQMALGACYKENSSGGPAAQHYEYAQTLEPKNPLPKLMLAKVYRIAKVPEKTLLFYNKAIEVAPGYSPALRGKAEYFFFVQYNYEEATKSYKELVEKGSEVKIEDEMQLANCYYLTKDCKACSDLVEKILQKDPSKNYLRRLQAYCDYENGELARGLKILNEYFKSVTPDKLLPSDFEYHAKFLVQTKGDTTQAIKDYKKVVQMDKSRWAVYEEVDKLEWARKNYCGALNVYKMYLDSVASPKATDWYNLGMRHYFCKEDAMHFKNAEMAFAKVTETNPEAGIGWLWAGKSASKLDVDVTQDTSAAAIAKFGLAKPYFEKYIQLASADATKNKKDLIAAYEYVLYFYYLKKDDAAFCGTVCGLVDLDPINVTAKGLSESVSCTPCPPPSPNPSGCATVQCSGTTQKGDRCLNRTTDCSSKCYLHR
jgi:tetratricopeptide (TPR) repeat protein